MLNNLKNSPESDLITEVEQESDTVTLERTDELPLRFRGNLIHKYKSRDSNVYELYETDESVKDIIYVVSVNENSFTETKSTVTLFDDSEECRQFFIEKLGSFESLEFQVFLGDEDVERLE